MLEPVAAAPSSSRGTAGRWPVQVATATTPRILVSGTSSQPSPGVNASVVIPATASDKASELPRKTADLPQKTAELAEPPQQAADNTAQEANGQAGSPQEIQAHEIAARPAQAAPGSAYLDSRAAGEEASVRLPETPIQEPTSPAEACGAGLPGLELEEQPPSSVESRHYCPPSGCGNGGGGGSVSSSHAPVRLDDAPDGQSSEQPRISYATASLGHALEQANALRSRCGAVEGIALRARGLLQQRASSEARLHHPVDADRDASGAIGSLAEGFFQAREAREETLMAQSMPGAGPLPSSSSMLASSSAGPLPPTPLNLAPTRSASAASCSALSGAAGMTGSASAMSVGMSVPGSAAAEMENGVDAEAVFSAFAQAGLTQASSSSQASPSRSASRPRSPPRFMDLYGDALARRERQQARTASQLRQRKASEEQQQLQLQLQKVERQASYKGRQDLRTHEERELDMVRRRQTWTQAHQTQQALREQHEMRECTFQPEIRSQSRDRASSSVQGAASTVSSSTCSSAATGRPSATASRAESRARNGAARRAGSESHSPRRDQMMELRKLQEKQMAVLRQLGEICASGGGGAAEPPGSGGDPCDSPRDHLRMRSSQGAAKAPDGPEKLATELHLYRLQLAQVHALERLDMQALELPPKRLQMLLTTGFRLGLAEGLRRKLKRPPNGAGVGSPEGAAAALPLHLPQEKIAGESRLPQPAESNGTWAAPVLPATSAMTDCTDDELLSASSPS